jgi:hypothetical protein
MRHALGVILLFVLGSAQATPVTWTVDAQFEDGAFLTGTFMYDEDLNIYTNSDLVTTTGSIEGRTYTLASTTLGTATVLSLPSDGNTPPDFSDWADRNIMVLEFNSALTNEGGVISIVSGSSPFDSSFEGPMGVGSFPSIPEIRLVASGTVSAVPIPAAVWLFGSGLAGLGWMRRRKTV